MKTLRRILMESRGQALVETALALPLLLMFLWGVVECGRISHAYLVIAHAAREGARAGAVSSNNETITKVINQRTTTLSEEKITLEITPAPTDRFSGDSLRVVVCYELPMSFPLWGTALPNPLPLEADTVMRLE